MKALVSEDLKVCFDCLWLFGPFFSLPASQAGSSPPRPSILSSTAPKLSPAQNSSSQGTSKARLSLKTSSNRQLSILKRQTKPGQTGSSLQTLSTSLSGTTTGSLNMKSHIRWMAIDTPCRVTPFTFLYFQGSTYNGYLSLCAAINRTLDSGVKLTDPEVYGKLTESELDAYLMGDNGVPCPLIDLRIECLKGRVLKKEENWYFKVEDIFPAFSLRNRSKSDWWIL